MYYISAAKTTQTDKSSTSNIVRLVGGARNQGKVELYRRGEWGAVCNDGWNIRYGDMVCKMLGYSKASWVYSVERGRNGRGRMWIIDERCDDRDSFIKNCLERSREWHSCYQGKEAAVRCD